jgi:dTDP-4-dehydrorhamnose reductase
VRVPDDEIVSPSFVPELVDAALDLLIDGMQGLWHATNTGAISLFQLARAAAVRSGIPTNALEAGASLHPWGAEVGPGMRALASERAATMSAIDVALAAYVATTTPQSRVTTAA